MATQINWGEIFKRDKSLGVRLLLEHRGDSSIWILEDAFFFGQKVCGCSHRHKLYVTGGIM